MEYEFQFVVEGVSIDDDDAVAALAENFDALVSWHRGTHLLSVAGEGRNAVDAAQKLVSELATAFPALRLLHLDPDLVGVADIAERTGRSRQNVQQWVDGNRHAGTPFPRPEGAVGRSLVWRWSDVNAWLESRNLSDGEARASRDEAALIDVILLQWRQTLERGEPLLKFVVAGDEHTSERQALMQRVSSAYAGDSKFRADLVAWPRDNPHQLTVVCSDAFDSLKFVVEQLGTEQSGILAVMSDDNELYVTPIASVKLPWTVPVSELGLTANATVGDLILMQRASTEAKKPLTIA